MPFTTTRYVSSFLLLIAVVVATVWMLRLRVAEVAVTSWLGSHGIDSSARVDALSLYQVHASSIRLGSPAVLRIGSLKLDLSWESIAPRLQSIRASEVELSATREGNEVSFGVLDELLGLESPPQSAAGTFELPSMGIDLEGFVLLVREPDREIRLEADLSLPECRDGMRAAHADTSIEVAGRGKVARLVLRDGGDDLLLAEIDADLAALASEESAGPLLNQGAQAVVEVRIPKRMLCDRIDDRLEAPFHASLRAPRVQLDDFEATDLTATIDGGLRVEGGNVELVSDRCIEVSVQSPFEAAGWSVVAPESVCIEAIDGRWFWTEAEPANWRVGLRLPSSSFELRSRDGESIAGVLPNFVLEGGGVADAASVSVTTSGGRVDWKAVGLTIEEIAARTEIDVDEGLIEPLHLNVEALRWTTSSPHTLPLAAELRITRDGSGLGVSGQLFDVERGVAIDVEALQTPSAEGAARLRLSPVDFGSPGAPLAVLLPSIATIVDDARGRLAADLRIDWGSPDGFAADFRLNADDLDIEVAGLLVEGLRGSAEFFGLNPPYTRQPQTLHFDRLTAGSSLSDGSLRFTVAEDGRVKIERAEGHFAGGRLRAVGDLGFDSDEQRIVLRVAQIDAASLAELVAGDGSLEASGRLWGKVPVVIGEGAIGLERAVLAAGKEGGVIRYRPGVSPPAPPGAGARWDWVLRLLEDFHYRHLRLYIDGELEGELVAKLELRGSNPAIEGGRPVELTMNLSGAIGPIISASLFGNEIVDRVRARILGRNRQ